jgi:hypothetical protein
MRVGHDIEKLTGRSVHLGDPADLAVTSIDSSNCHDLSVPSAACTSPRRLCFRVRGRARFACGLDESGVSLMPSQAAIRETVAEWPLARAPAGLGTGHLSSAA